MFGLHQLMLRGASGLRVDRPSRAEASAICSRCAANAHLLFRRLDMVGEPLPRLGHVDDRSMSASGVSEPTSFGDPPTANPPDASSVHDRGHKSSSWRLDDVPIAFVSVVMNISRAGDATRGRTGAKTAVPPATPDAP